MDRLAEKLSEVKSKGVKVTVRTDAMSTIPKSMRPLTVQSVDVTNPVALIDRKIVWYGLPSAGKAFFSKAIKGEGTSKPILRCESERLCRTLYGLLKITAE